MSRMPPRKISVFTSHKMTSISGKENILFPIQFYFLMSQRPHIACTMWVHHDNWERDLSCSGTPQFREVLLLFHFIYMHLENRKSGFKCAI